MNTENATVQLATLDKVTVLQDLLSNYDCPELCAKIIKNTAALLSLMFVNHNEDRREVRVADYQTDSDNAVETGELIYKQFEGVCELLCDYNPEAYNMVHAFIDKSMELQYAPSEHYGLLQTIIKFEWGMNNVIYTLDQAYKDANSLGEYTPKSE
jgi:hypothetical protein